MKIAVIFEKSIGAEDRRLTTHYVKCTVAAPTCLPFHHPSTMFLQHTSNAHCLLRLPLGDLLTHYHRNQSLKWFTDHNHGTA